MFIKLINKGERLNIRLTPSDLIRNYLIFVHVRMFDILRLFMYFWLIIAQTGSHIDDACEYKK